MLDVVRYSIKNEELSPWIKFIWQIEVSNVNLHYKLLPTECIDLSLWRLLTADL